MHGASRLALPRLSHTLSAALEARAASGSAAPVVQPSIDCYCIGAVPKV